MSDFHYELSYLIVCKHFVDVFLPIIVSVTLRNIIFFVLMEKTKLICEPQCFTFLMSKSFTMNYSMKLSAM